MLQLKEEMDELTKIIHINLCMCKNLIRDGASKNNGKRRKYSNYITEKAMYIETTI